MKKPIIILLFTFMLVACDLNTEQTKHANPELVVAVNTSYLKAANAKTTWTKTPCTLSDGTETDCYKIVTNAIPTDHRMGPWCPNHISDEASVGGIWLNEGKVYDVDGPFIEKLADLYKDNTWRMYDDAGKVFVTATKEDCINAANPQVGEEYKNFCVECLPSYLSNLSKSYLIPVKPVMTTTAITFMGRGGGGPGADRPDRPKRGNPPEKGERPPRGDRPGGGKGAVPSTRGIALNGVEFSAPAPLNNILDAYTLAPFDDAGGHINIHQGYHYHAATGVSFSIEQSDGHAPLIGYAMDGHGIYAREDKNGNEPMDLDECRGHYDGLRGYHYHVDAAGNNNFINCLHGAYAQ